MRILLILSSLNQGGIERQISHLAPALIAKGHQVTIAVSKGGGFYENGLRVAGVTIVSANTYPGLRRRNLPARTAHILRRMTTITRLAMQNRYDVVYGFGMTSNHYAVLAKPFGRSKVVWGVRNSLPITSKPALLIERVFSRFVDLTISNSEAGLEVYRDKNIKFRKTLVLPNGIDTALNRPDKSWRRQVRSDLGIEDGVALIGTVARIDEYKDHPTLLRAARRLVDCMPNARFVIVGQGQPAWVDSLKHLAAELGLSSHIIWTGARPDVERYLNAMDIFVSCSTTEGFPNVIAEAMSVGLSCVVTPAGDSTAIVGDLGTIVPFGDEAQIATAIQQALAANTPKAEERRRARINELFSIDRLVNHTEAALAALVSQGEAR